MVAITTRREVIFITMLLGVVVIAPLAALQQDCYDKQGAERCDCLVKKMPNFSYEVCMSNQAPQPKPHPEANEQKCVRKCDPDTAIDWMECSCPSGVMRQCTIALTGFDTGRYIHPQMNVFIENAKQEISSLIRTSSSLNISSITVSGQTDGEKNNGVGSDPRERSIEPIWLSECIQEFALETPFDDSELGTLRGCIVFKTLSRELFDPLIINPSESHSILEHSKARDLDDGASCKCSDRRVDVVVRIVGACK